jgi:hypothetical protein
MVRILRTWCSGAAALGLVLACSAQNSPASNAPGEGGTGGGAATTGGSAGRDAGPDALLDLDGSGPDTGPATPRSDQVDLLFVIDNSMSMADKQEILAQTIPDLIARMATPDCVLRNAATDAVEQRFGASTVDGTCASGELEFRPVTDIHIAVISSSLGGHGSTDNCNPGAGTDYDPSQEDMAHLLTRAADGGVVATPGDQGFLAWDPAGRYGAPSTDLPALQASFADLVRGVGERGCGFEAPLESAYRFMIQPDPYDHLELDASYSPALAVPTGTDAVVLAERASFLRHDSLVAIFTISDENDCSVRDEYSQYYWIALNAPMPRATSQCTSPNDPCCTSCVAAAWPDGCSQTGAPAADTGCQPSPYYAYPDPADHINVRCFDEKQRFGVDYLWPVQRYIDGIESTVVPDRDGHLVNNPIYCAADDAACASPRDRSFVFWVGITGVPWQDVAVDPTTLAQGLRSGQALLDSGRWDVILGDPATGVAPTDPHMISSITPRSGSNPLTNDAILPPDTTAWDPISGHERTLAGGQDLQYACIFPLPASRVCATDDQKNCDCRPEADPIGTSNPLCQAGAGSALGSEQFYAKAYPGTRILEVLRGLDPNQIVVSSICPANMTDSQAPDYGYRPVVPPLMDRLVTVLVPQ